MPLSCSFACDASLMLCPHPCCKSCSNHERCVHLGTPAHTPPIPPAPDTPPIPLCPATAAMQCPLEYPLAPGAITWAICYALCVANFVAESSARVTCALTNRLHAPLSTLHMYHVLTTSRATTCIMCSLHLGQLHVSCAHSSRATTSRGNRIPTSSATIREREGAWQRSEGCRRSGQRLPACMA
jgi:hypothetical protein